MCIGLGFVLTKHKIRCREVLSIYDWFLKRPYISGHKVVLINIPRHLSTSDKSVFMVIMKKLYSF